jgi:hypothetical protein
MVLPMALSMVLLYGLMVLLMAFSAFFRLDMAALFVVFCLIVHLFRSLGPAISGADSRRVSGVVFCLIVHLFRSLGPAISGADSRRVSGVGEYF